ncbi:hypothetical protein [Allokutzneria albata]|uniref:Uncharacterized protein n=1 Tax=Allokutzneria albata TaxID=211114 RepID=A0A1G9UA14_ALLAB|nr:hypothetical protein [Allokutzneria albata]SDM56672.1 hypothetical protein SAMN04489726_2287 [Allokutzneria albata]
MKTGRIRSSLAKFGAVAALVAAPLVTATPAHAGPEGPPPGHCGYYSWAVGANENNSWFVNCSYRTAYVRISLPVNFVYRCLGTGTTDLTYELGNSYIRGATALRAC